MRLGVIGCDSSHLPEFSKRVNQLHQKRRTPVKVTGFWTDGRHDLPEESVEKWKLQTKAYGVAQVDSLDQLLDQCDGVMVLSVNGQRHLEHALPALQRGLPTYIDKPLTCDLAQAKKLLAASQRYGARCYSASSLRFALEVEQLERAGLGRLLTVEAVGPGELNPAMPGLFYYGVHTVEMVDALWGPGVNRVRCVRTAERDLVDLQYHDGRVAHLRMERAGSYTFAATVHGEKGLAQFKVDFGPVYDRLIAGLVRFFEGGPEPVTLERIVENVAVMAAGNRSMEQNGTWVSL